MLKVQTYLRDLYSQGGTQQYCLDTLTKELGIKAKVYEDEGIVLLDYDQIASPKTHPIVIECRSLILNMKNFGVVSRKFDRFFNFGEALEYYEDFNFGSSQIMEKADGSLIGVYYWNDKWNISTRGMAFAEGPHQSGGTFKDKVLEAFGLSEGEFQLAFSEAVNSEVTCIFEYTSPENRIVTRYEEPEMVLLETTGPHPSGSSLLSKVKILNAAGIKCRAPKFYSASDMDEVVQMVNSLPDLQEGFVLYDPMSKKRMKVKSSLYVVAHTLRGNDPLPTRKNLLKVLFTGELDEFITYFPEWKDKAFECTTDVENTLYFLEGAYLANKDIESQKDFALAIKDIEHKHLLFQARKVNSTPTEAFNSLDLNKKLDMFI